MKKNVSFVLMFLVFAFVFSACGYAADSTDIEKAQQESGTKSLFENQPLPDLGGYSFERQIVIDTYSARNRIVATWSYLFTMQGAIIEICPSIGYPIPYTTQLTNPLKIDGNSYGYTSIGNPEPNGLYTGTTSATFVQCVQSDGSVTPVYIESEVLAFPYRIQSNAQIVPITESSFKIDVTK